MFAKLHSKLGDFWWYSLMIFCACRAGDLMNAFVGLWLVPKYVDPSELGAVTPLTQFASFLAIPVAAFASTFRNELSHLSIGREFGKLKTLLRGVFVATAIFLFVAIVVARVVLPAFLERIRIVEGSLGIIIIVSSFINAVSPVYSNALQALKKFKTQSVLNIVGAPVRLVVMLIAMPFRALTGYFAGQAATPVFNIFASVFSLRKELSAHAEPYWTHETFKKFSSLLAIFLVAGIAGGFNGLVESTIIRQRLPDIDSAGYYMATRFSEIAAFLSTTLSFTIFPFAADRAAEGKDLRPIILKAFAASMAFCLVVAIPFGFFGQEILSILPHGDKYAAYWWAIPWHITIIAISSLLGLYITAQISVNHFGYLKWYMPLDVAYPVLLLLVTGHGYFAGLIPASWTEFLSRHNICSLSTMLWWMTANSVIKAVFCLVAMRKSDNLER